MLKRFLKAANIGLFLLGIGLMASFVLAGSYVDDSGFLVERFAAWGLGILLVISSLVGFLIWALIALAGRSRK